MNYEKLTVESFAAKLKEGKYETLTGARRAIGKTSSWSPKEKEKAQELANKHFDGAPVPKAVTKAATKKLDAAPAKKTAKKTAKKAAKSVAVKEYQTTGGNEEPIRAVEEPRPEPIRKAQMSEHKTQASAASTLLPDAVNMGRQVLSFLAEARAEYTAQKELNPGGDFSRLLSDMKDAGTRAVSLVAVNVPQTEKIDAFPPARVALPMTPHKAETKKVAPVTTAHAPTASISAPASGTLIEPAPPNGTTQLTPEEQALADRIRTAPPASTIAALPRPVTPEG